MSNVFVLDTKKGPLNPVSPGYARLLLKRGHAAVFRRYPFTLILKRVVAVSTCEPLRVKLDPGSQITGIAVVNDATGNVVWAAELQHRGSTIKKSLDERRALRRSRRQRKTRFDNRRKRQRWLPPSLESRIANIETWVRRLMRLCPLTSISQEVVKFDLQKMENPEISGIEYQQGTLAGYEVRQYLLEKWRRQCAYCTIKDVPLEVEHMTARVRGGTNRISNLTLACKTCNTKKGKMDIREFLKEKPDLLKKVLAQAKAPLKDAAAVNATRWALYERLKMFGVPVECGSGGLTKFNRTLHGLDKTHWLDATCVGKSTPDILTVTAVVPLLITATGHGARQMCGTNTHGFPIRHKTRQKRFFGFQTGDMVKAIVPKGKKQGVHVGRLLVRATGWCDIQMAYGRVQGIHARYCQAVHRSDGYRYTSQKMEGEEVAHSLHAQPQRRRGHSSPA